MRILLLGEYSSLHKFLKEGLKELGLDVTVASNGDSWKRISGNDTVLFYSNGRGLKRRYQLLIEPFKIAEGFKDYDLVQFINPVLYSPIVNNSIIKKIANQNNCLSLAACGIDYALWKAYKRKCFNYYVFDYDKGAACTYDIKNFYGKLNVKSARMLENKADIIIPSLYEYAIGYNTKKCCAPIPFPINVKAIKYQDNHAGRKIVFFHGLNREKAKGTPFIRAAMQRLEEAYPNDVEIILDGHMPYERYIKIMEKANVVIDQCCCYGYGINACIAMAQGKVVLSGNRIETRSGLRVNECPILHVEPDTEKIYKKLLYILENKKEITGIGYASRKYVENTHDHIKIAQRYLDAWKATGKL